MTSPLAAAANVGWRGRGRWVLLVLAVLFLVGGVGAAGWWWHGRPAPPEPPLPAHFQDPEVRRAVELARQKVLDRPTDGTAWGNLGMTLEAHLYEAEADRCFAEAARLAPDDVRWPYFRGLYALKTDPENALPYLRQAAALHAAPEQETAVRLRLAEALLVRRELDEAEPLFRAEWQRRPGDPRAAYGLGLIALARGDDRTAEPYLTAARSSPTARRPATAQLAALARAAGDEAAATRFDAEGAPQPGDRVAWPDPLVEEILDREVGTASQLHEVVRLEQERKFGDAAQIYLELLDTRPTAEVYVGAGLNLARVGDYTRAVPLLREGVERYPDSVELHYTLAQVQFSRAEKDAAQGPPSETARDWFREAIEQSQRTVKLKPDHAGAYLFWGLALKHLGEPAAAVAPLRQGVTCRPADFDLQFALGNVLLDAGRPSEAETYLKNAQELKPHDEVVAQALARLRGPPRP